MWIGLEMRKGTIWNGEKRVGVISLETELIFYNLALLGLVNRVTVVGVVCHVVFLILFSVVGALVTRAIFRFKFQKLNAKKHILIIYSLPFQRNKCSLLSTIPFILRYFYVSTVVHNLYSLLFLHNYVYFLYFSFIMSGIKVYRYKVVRR